MQGSSAELRELAAEALGELVDVTSQEALRPFTVQITGAAVFPAALRSTPLQWYDTLCMVRCISELFDCLRQVR